MIQLVTLKSWRVVTKRSGLICRLIGALVLCSAAAAIAEEAAPTAAPTATPLPQTGSIASTTTRGLGSQSSPDIWGGISAAGASAAPITGSVSRVGTKRWVMRLFNNSKDSYSVDVALEQTGSKGARLRADNFSISLPPGKSAERIVAAHPSSSGASVNLRKWRKASKAQPTVIPAAVATPGLPKEESVDFNEEYKNRMR